MRVLDLFSGIGGFSLGLERAGMETVAFCEYDEKCRQVLHKHWPDVPIYEDVRTLTAETLANDGIDDVGLICGGFPCQPFSLAGKRKGEADDRHLWPEMLRLIREVSPAWVIGENVVGLINMGLDTVLSDLEDAGYTAGVVVIPACAVDAPHRRDRVWILADAERDRPQGQWDGELDAPGSIGLRGGERRNEIAPVPDAGRGSSEGQGREISRSQEPARWLPEPPVGRVAHGIPGRVDRLKQLGNAVVPQVVEALGAWVMEVADG